MKYLTLEQVLQLHVLVIAQFGGSDGLRDLGRLEAAIGTQKQTAFGRDVYESEINKAAALCRSIISGHPFIDGNKRTAMLCALTLLSINGLEVNAEIGELEDFAVSIAKDQLDVPAIAKWLEAYSAETAN